MPPPGWVSYTLPGSESSVCYPSSWQVISEDAGYVALAASARGRAVLSLVRTDCFERYGSYDLASISDCAAAEREAGTSPTSTQKNLASEYREEGPFAGVAQAVLWHRVVDGADVALYDIAVPLRGEWAFTATYLEPGADEVGEEERRTLGAVVSTLRTEQGDVPASMIAESLDAWEAAAAGGAGAMPVGWLSYTVPSGLFSVSYPGWLHELADSETGDIDLTAPAPLYSDVSFAPESTDCFDGIGPGLEGLDRCAEQIVEGLSQLYSCEVVVKGARDDGVHKGYRFDVTCRPKDVTDTHAEDMGQVQVIIPLSKGRVFMVSYTMPRARKLTQLEEQLLKAVVSSLRIDAARVAPE